MIVSIHQPDYIPYLGYFYKLAKSDVFVFLDDCQYSNNNYHNWNIVKSPQGSLRLKIPVEQHMGDLITEVRTKDALNWKEKHLKSIEMFYKKAPYYDEVMSLLRSVLLVDYQNIADLNVAIICTICEKFGFQTKLFRSSDLKIESTREERVLDICSHFGATEYISGMGASVYQKEKDFNARGIKLTYTDYEPITYPQLWGEFIPNMSVVDYIMNVGFDGGFVKR